MRGGAGAGRGSNGMDCVRVWVGWVGGCGRLGVVAGAVGVVGVGVVAGMVRLCPHPSHKMCATWRSPTVRHSSTRPPRAGAGRSRPGSGGPGGQGSRKRKTEWPEGTVMAWCKCGAKGPKGKGHNKPMQGGVRGGWCGSFRLSAPPGPAVE